MPLISNLGAEVDLEIVSGTDWSTTLTLLNGDGTPVNLTGCSISAAIKKTPLTALVALTLTLVPAADLTTGVVTLSVAYAVNNLDGGLTSTDPVGQYVWDLRLVDSLGKVSRLVYGKATIWAGVTPPP